LPNVQQLYQSCYRISTVYPTALYMITNNRLLLVHPAQTGSVRESFQYFIMKKMPPFLFRGKGFPGTYWKSTLCVASFLA